MSGMVSAQGVGPGCCAPDTPSPGVDMTPISAAIWASRHGTGYRFTRLASASSCARICPGSPLRGGVNRMVGRLGDEAATTIPILFEQLCDLNEAPFPRHLNQAAVVPRPLGIDTSI